MNQKLTVLIGAFFASLVNPFAAFSANVTINGTSNLFPIANTAYGMHVSVYDNQHTNVDLPSRLIESGVNTLRYPGGGYANVFHWSVNKLSPWQGGSYGYQGPKTDFGYFVGILDAAQCQTVITVNFGSGQLWNGGHTSLVAPPTNAEPKEAAAWVAYANSDASLFGTTNDITIGTDSLGNNWRTAGFWAKLRSSTQAQYQTWATAAGVYDSTFNFLAINHPTPVGVKYWEIGNETFGTGYYGGGDGYSVNYAVPYPYTTNIRSNNPALSPAIYGQQVKAFSLAMKAVDPTIKIGAVVSTPLDDYGWDVIPSTGQHWTPQVLSQCASNIDFIIAHWYFWNNNNDNGNNLLPAVAAKIPSMINGINTHLGTDSGLRDWINQHRPGDPTNVEMFITEFGYTGTLALNSGGRPIIGPVTMLFDVDSYATWMRYGVTNVCFLEMNKTPFIGDSAALTRGETFYGLKLLHEMARPGDMMVNATSDTSTIRVQATRQQSGKVGILLLNEHLTSTQTVNVTISNVPVSTNGMQYVFGRSNFITSQELPTSGPSSNSVFGLGNSFSVSILPHTMMVYTIPTVGTIPTTLDLTSGANPSTYGNPVTITATVKTNGVALTSITGETITFYDSATLLGTSTLKGNGSASVITASNQLTAGSHSVTAVYGGDGLFSGSTNSPPLSQTVNPLNVSVASGLLANDKVYDGTTSATISSSNVVLNGVLTSDSTNVNLSTSGYSASFASPDPGSSISVTVTGLSLVGSASGNYTLAPVAGLTADILPLEMPTLIGTSFEPGTVQLTFSAQQGQTYKVVAASDITLSLEQWTVLTNGTFGLGPVTFTEDVPPEIQDRFYRIISP